MGNHQDQPGRKTGYEEEDQKVSRNSKTTYFCDVLVFFFVWVWP